MKKVSNCQSICQFLYLVLTVTVGLKTLIGSFLGLFGVDLSNPIFSTLPPLFNSEGGFFISASLFASFCLMESPQTELYVKAKLYTRRNDLSKRWYVEFSAIDDNTGQLKKKQIFCPSKFTTKKQREIWGNEICEKINKILAKGARLGKYVPEENKIQDTPKTLKELLPLGIDKSLRKKTKETYNTAVNKFIDYLGRRADKDISIITPVLINNFQRSLIDSGLENSTINNILLKTKTVFSHLHKTGLIPNQVFYYTKLTVTDSESHEYFNHAERHEIEHHLIEHHPQLYLLTRFIYYTFVRPGELRKLKFSDIDFSRGTLTVPGKISKNRKTLTIPIHPELLKLLPNHYPANYYIFGKDLNHSPFMAGTNSAYYQHKIILEKLGFGGLNYTLYSWKHTGAVNAYTAGTDLKTLQFLLRHTTVQHTEIYLRKLRILTQEIKLKAW